MRALPLISVLALLVMSTACRRPSVDFDHEVTQLPVDRAVRGLYVQGDSLIAVGGDFNGRGFVVTGALETMDFELQLDGLKRELYAIGKNGSTWYVTGDSLLVYRGKQLGALEQMFWRREDWVSDLSNHAIRDVVADSTGILMVVGGQLAFGVIFHSYDGGGFWNPIEPNNALRCAEIRDGYAWVGGNGILMRSLWGTGEWERLRLEDSYLTDIRFFNSLEGLALTESGTILESDDGGTSWVRVHRKRAPFMYAMASDGEAVVCVGDQGALLYRASQVAEWQLGFIPDVRELNDVVISEGMCYLAADGGRIISFPLEALR